MCRQAISTLFAFNMKILMFTYETPCGARDNWVEEIYSRLERNLLINWY